MKRAGFFLLSGLVIAAAAGRAQDKVPAAVASFFAKRCVDCHKGKFPPQGLSWQAKKIGAAIDAPSREVPELKIIDSAAPESSYVLKKVRGETGIKGRRMPPGKTLDPSEIKVLEDWIRSLKKTPL